jgi:hypothetical protein
MRDEIFNIEKGSDGLWYLSPMRADTNGTYLIRTKSKAKATNIKLRILEAVDALPTPTENLMLYRKVGYVGDTPVYELI